MRLLLLALVLGLVWGCCWAGWGGGRLLGSGLLLLLQLGLGLGTGPQLLGPLLLGPLTRGRSGPGPGPNRPGDSGEGCRASSPSRIPGGQRELTAAATKDVKLV